MGLIQSQLGSEHPPAARRPSITPTSEELEDARDALRMRFLVLAPRRVVALRAALFTAATDGLARRELQRLGHQLHGTSATVGLVDLGLLGVVIERTAAETPYADAQHARATTAVALVDEFVVRARRELGATTIADDPRFRALFGEQR